jgi:carbon monoxide dehydrogenase subunit G
MSYLINIHFAMVKMSQNGSFQNRSILPPRRKFLPSGGGGEKKLFLIIVNVLGHPKGVGGLTSYFLHGGGMDVFWNDPL